MHNFLHSQYLKNNCIRQYRCSSTAGSVNIQKYTIVTRIPNEKANKIHKAKTDKSEKRNDNLTVRVGETSIPTSILNNGQSKQKINKETEVINTTIYKLHLAVIRGILYPTTAYNSSQAFLEYSPEKTICYLIT